MTESRNPFAFWIALRSGVTLSALFEMNKIGELVLLVNGPGTKVSPESIVEGENYWYEPVKRHLASTLHPMHESLKFAIAAPAALLMPSNTST